MQIALFVTCLTDALSPSAGKAVVEVLERLGHEVVFPEAQTCCGQMHLNSGYRREAHALARRFVAVFSRFDAIVTPSASCAGTVLEGYRNLAEDLADGELAAGVEHLGATLYEFSQLLVDVLRVTDVGAAFPHRVAYHPSCHSLRVLHLRDQPLQLLANVAGLELVEHADRESCCGFGGTFSMKNAATSTAMMQDKLQAVTDAGAEVLCSVDSSCLTHLGGGASRERLPLRTMHLAEILATSRGSAPVH